MWVKRAWLGAVLGVLATSACSTPYALPDRSDPEVQATEAALVESLGSSGAMCEARLLGTEGDDTVFAWLRCEAAGVGISAPVRLDGEQLQVPGDGSRYVADVEELFPAGLAERILDDSGALRP